MSYEASDISSETLTPGHQVSFTNLVIDADQETRRISNHIRDTLVSVFKRRGAIIAMSGGIDSSVTAALCAQAVGPDRVIGLLMPERHSSSDTSRLGKLVGDSLKIKIVEHDITDTLESLGCYTNQDEAIKAIIPEYQRGFPFKITLPSFSGNERYRLFSLVVQTPDGKTLRERINHDSYLRLVAATNFKQRVRKLIEYYYADRYNYAVAGSPNRLEYDQGFFVKGGDGAADFKPIAHLYKTQVYRLAEHLGIPDEIRNRPPTTDTYPMEQSQEEFYFSLPYDKMDLCLFAKNSGLPPESVMRATGLSAIQARNVFEDIDTKRRTTRYLHLSPVLTDHIPQVEK